MPPHRISKTKFNVPSPEQLEIRGEECFAFVCKKATKSDPKSVLDAIDTFGYEHSWMMNVGDVKGEIIDNELARVKPKMIEFAGLSALVTIFVGTFGDKYCKLKERGIDHVDVFFLDHDKKCYKSDLEIIEHTGLLRVVSVVIADNVFFAQISDYLEYVRGHAHFKSVMHDSFLEYSETKDAVEVSTYVA